MRYLLDTCVLSDFVKGNSNTIQHLTKTSPTDIAISCITVMEIEYGILRIDGKKAIKIRQVMDDIINMIHIFPLDFKVSIHAAKIRADLAKKGQPIGVYDILIAATAYAYDQSDKVADNLKEFGSNVGEVLRKVGDSVIGGIQLYQE